MSLNPNAPRAPYSLEPTTFPFPALATMAGRAALGGPRELALACLLVARIVGDATAPHDPLAPDHHQARASDAKHWLGSAAIPTVIKTALSRLLEAAGNQDRKAIKAGVESVMIVTANQLDPAARLELARLAQTIAE